MKGLVDFEQWLCNFPEVTTAKFSLDNLEACMDNTKSSRLTQWKRGQRCSISSESGLKRSQFWRKNHGLTVTYRILCCFLYYSRTETPCAFSERLQRFQRTIPTISKKSHICNPRYSSEPIAGPLFSAVRHLLWENSRCSDGQRNNSKSAPMRSR